MDKNTYLQTPAVANFVQWMSKNLDNNTFAHQYSNRRSRDAWACSSLYEAYVQYQWAHPGNLRLGKSAGSTFKSSADTLMALAKDLRVAIGREDEHSLVTAAVDVMAWGGVRAGNVRWLYANQGVLSAIISSTQKALDSGNAADSRLTVKGLRFNAGMTKIYSLICSRFVIYDSRVAAALGWAVVKFCHATGLSQVPKELCFPWAPAKGSPKDLSSKSRNPSQSGFIFPRLRSGSTHAVWNMYASWLLSEVLEQASASSCFAQISPFENRLRALEAALFMIGYDLNTKPAALPLATPSIDVYDSWNDSQTLGKGNPFRYRVTKAGIEIDGGPIFTCSDIALTLNRLWTDFGSAAFPLANSATGVREGTVAKGMGSAYFGVTGTNPPNTSKLAAVLEELGAIIPVEDKATRGLSWALDLRKLGLSQRGNCLDFDAFWGEILSVEEES